MVDSIDYEGFPDFDDDPQVGRWNRWSYIDARDSALAVRLALRTREPGFDTFVIANADTVMSRFSASLLSEVFPAVEVRADLAEHQSLLSIKKAQDKLGFQPR